MIEDMKFIATALMSSGPMFVVSGSEEYGLGLIVTGALMHALIHAVSWLGMAMGRRGKREVKS